MSKILLVEDDKDIIENLSAVLRAEGFRVIMTRESDVSTAMRASAAFRRRRPATS